MDFQRTGANGREPLPKLAMQKVVGSSPIIRFKSPCWKWFFAVSGKRSQVLR
jgi:hypothetical protein